MKLLFCTFISISVLLPVNYIWGQNIHADIADMTNCERYGAQYEGVYQNYYRYEINSSSIGGILISMQNGNNPTNFCSVFIKSHGSVSPGSFIEWSDVCPETNRNDITTFRILDNFLRTRYGDDLEYSSNLQTSVEKYPSSYELWGAISNNGHELSSILSNCASQQPQIILTLNNETLSVTYILDDTLYNNHLSYLHKENPIYFEERKGIAKLFLDFPQPYPRNITTKFPVSEEYLQNCQRLKSQLSILHKEANSIQQELSKLYGDQKKAIDQISNHTKKALAEEVIRQRQLFEAENTKAIEKYKKLCEYCKKKPYDTTKKYQKQDCEKLLIKSLKSYINRIDTVSITRPLHDTTMRYNILITEKQKELQTSQQNLTNIDMSLDSLKQKDVATQILNMSFLNTSNLNLSYKCTNCLYKSANSDLYNLPEPFKQLRESQLRDDCMFIIFEADNNIAEALNLPARIVSYISLTNDLSFFKGSVRKDIDYVKIPTKYKGVDYSFLEHISTEQCEKYLSYTILRPVSSNQSFVWENDFINALINCQTNCKNDYFKSYGEKLGLACYQKQVILGMTPEMVRIADQDIVSQTWTIITNTHTDEQGRLIITWQKKHSAFYDKQYQAYIFTDGILTKQNPNPFR